MYSAMLNLPNVGCSSKRALESLKPRYEIPHVDRDGDVEMRDVENEDVEMKDGEGDVRLETGVPWSKKTVTVVEYIEHVMYRV